MTCRGRAGIRMAGRQAWGDGDDKYARGWVKLPAAVGVALWEASSKEAGVETPKKEKVRGEEAATKGIQRRGRGKRNVMRLTHPRQNPPPGPSPNRRSPHRCRGPQRRLRGRVRVPRHPPLARSRCARLVAGAVCALSAVRLL